MRVYNWGRARRVWTSASKLALYLLLLIFQLRGIPLRDEQAFFCRESQSGQTIRRGRRRTNVFKIIYKLFLSSGRHRL